MPIPGENTHWPPETTVRDWWTKVEEWEAWYSGDPSILEEFFNERGAQSPMLQKRFWANLRGENADYVRALHLPLAADIAATSANLLFAEAPKITFGAQSEAEERMNVLIEDGTLHSNLIEAAEMAAGLGGVFIKIDVDADISTHPIIHAVRPFNAIPMFQHGFLRDVVFWRVVKSDDTKIWFLFEERSRVGGMLSIRYQLFEGNSENTGKKVSMESIAETAGLELEDRLYDMPGLGCVYVPNMLPNRLNPGNAMGIPDVSGSESVLDALDESWSSWLRDIRLGMGRMLIDKEMMRDDQTAGLSRFDPFKTTFVKLNLGELRLGQKDKYEPLKEIQFEMRAEEHRSTCEKLAEEIIVRAGYSPQTFGLHIEGQAESGTALRIRERKSMMTRGKKERYWRRALKELLMQLQWMDNVTSLAPTKYEPDEELVIQLEDSVVPDLAELSTTVKSLREASTLSQEMAIRMIHPDWNDEAVMEELVRLEDEAAVAMPDPFDEGQPPGGGDNDDEEVDDADSE